MYLHNKKLKTQRDRYKEALEKIANISVTVTIPSEFTWEPEQNLVIGNPITIATEAIKEGSEDQTLKSSTGDSNE